MPSHPAVHVAYADAELVDVETSSPPQDHVRTNVTPADLRNRPRLRQRRVPGPVLAITPGHEIAGKVAEGRARYRMVLTMRSPPARPGDHPEMITRS